VTPPPSESDLFALAERALEHAGEEAQATAWWERRLWASSHAAAAREWLSVEVKCVRDGAVGRVATEAVDDDGLRRAAMGAVRIAEARTGDHPGLPDPEPERPHDGWDPAILTLDPADAAVGLTPGRRWAAAAARTAIASTRGLRAYEQRTHARRAAGSVELAAVRAADVPEPDVPAPRVAAALAPSGRTRPHDGPAPAAPGVPPPDEPTSALAGEHAAVLGPAAVAAVLRRLDWEALAERRGRRVAAACVNLSESPRFAGTLPRTYDDEGRALSPAPLVQDGVATGNRGRDHLVLVGGGAADVAELAAPIEKGLYLPALDVAVPIRRGALLLEEAAPVRVELDPLELLGAAQALTAAQSVIPSAARSARTVGATVCPAVRFGGGLRLL
jgi:hypothetical protein